MAFLRKPPTVPATQDERQSPRDCLGLAAELSSADPVARRWAARDLMGCPEASGALVDRLLVEPDGSVRAVILTTLSRLGDAQAVNGLVRCLRSEDAALRNEAIDAMRQLPGEVAPLMRTLLGDADPDVRIFAVNILDSLRHPDVETWLIEVIREDAHVNVCATAVDLLVEVGSRDAREALVALMARFPGEPYVQFAAGLALKRIDEA